MREKRVRILAAAWRHGSFCYVEGSVVHGTSARGAPRRLTFNWVNYLSSPNHNPLGQT